MRNKKRWGCLHMHWRLLVQAVSGWSQDQCSTSANIGQSHLPWEIGHVTLIICNVTVGWVIMTVFYSFRRRCKTDTQKHTTEWQTNSGPIEPVKINKAKISEMRRPNDWLRATRKASRVSSLRTVDAIKAVRCNDPARPGSRSCRKRLTKLGMMLGSYTTSANTLYTSSKNTLYTTSKKKHTQLFVHLHWKTHNVQIWTWVVCTPSLEHTQCIDLEM